MTSRLWIRSLRAAFAGHAVAFLIVALLSWLALFLDNPSSAVLPIALVSLGAGAFVTALGIRKNALGILGALAGGGMFILPLFIVSCFGKGEVFSLGTRCLVFLAVMTVLLTVVLVFPKAKKKKRRKAAYPMKRR